MSRKRIHLIDSANTLAVPVPDLDRDYGGLPMQVDQRNLRLVDAAEAALKLNGIKSPGYWLFKTYGNGRIFAENLYLTRDLSSDAYSIVGGNGVSGTISIVSAGGTNWTVANTGTPAGPWTVTTAQLESGLPILLEAQTITTTAGPIYSIASSNNDPLFLCPSDDLAEYAYDWRVTGTFAGTGRVYDATADTDLLVESVITAYNAATGGFIGVESRTTAQVAAPEITPVSFTDQKLVDLSTISAGGSRIFVATFETPAVMASTLLWQGGTGFNPPEVKWAANGTLTVNLGAAVDSVIGALAPNTKYTVFACNGPTSRQVYLQQGATITAIVNTTAVSTATAIAKTSVARSDTDNRQFTGRMWRLFEASVNLDFSNSANRQLFTDAAGLVVLPSVAEGNVASFDLHLYSTARFETGTNDGVLGNLTKSGSTF